MKTRYYIPITDESDEVYFCSILIEGNKVTSEIVATTHVPPDGINPIVLNLHYARSRQLLDSHSTDVTTRILMHAVEAAHEISPKSIELAWFASSTSQTVSSQQAS